MNRYYSYWSDNNHKFNDPHRMTWNEDESVFPDVIFEARNIAEAKAKIDLLNQAIRGAERERFNAVKFLERDVK